MKTTKAEYLKLLADRPVKFTAKEVGFSEDDSGEYPCVSCIHFYIGMAMEHNVCEIMRPDDEDVPWNWSCKFHTVNGKDYPKLNGPE